METYQDVIKRLNLEPLQEEGGYFRRIYESINTNHDGRRFGASIFYLLEADDFSCFHRLDCDELWHSYAGESFIIYQIQPDGRLVTSILGNPFNDTDAVPCVLIPKGIWFAAEVKSRKRFGLAGCTTIPEFTYQGFEAAKRADLISLYPQHQDIITRLTRE